MSGLNCMERALLARAEAPSGTPLYCSINPTEGQGTARFFAVSLRGFATRLFPHPGGNPGANRKSIFYRCHLFEVAFVWDLTNETIHLPMGCLQGGEGSRLASARDP